MYIAALEMLYNKMLPPPAFRVFYIVGGGGAWVLAVDVMIGWDWLEWAPGEQLRWLVPLSSSKLEMATANKENIIII